MEYIDFLKSKEIITKASGFDIETNELNPNEFEWQKDVTRWALKKRQGVLVRGLRTR